MRQHIKLEDVHHYGYRIGYTSYPELYQPAIDALIATGLRFDNKTGIIRNNDGWIERPSASSDYQPHTCLEDVMQWEFNRYINNAVSRKIRGYDYV